MNDVNGNRLLIAETKARLINDTKNDSFGSIEWQKGTVTSWLREHKNDVIVLLEDMGPTKVCDLLNIEIHTLNAWRGPQSKTKQVNNAHVVKKPKVIKNSLETTEKELMMIRQDINNDLEKLNLLKESFDVVITYLKNIE